MKAQTCCFTGHRNIPKAQYPKIQMNLKKELIKLIAQGIRYFGSGGALGFDTIAALTIIALRKQYPHIKLIMVLPCKSQANAWNKKDEQVYSLILKEADKIVYISEKYYRGCMHKRNRHLADNSDICICYLAKEDGGTVYTVEYARRSGLRVINIA